MSTTTTQSTPKSVSSTSNVKEQMLQPGNIIGHCKVIELIAAGGMANVYKVWHEQLEVIRAIKILKPGFSDESRARLEMEAKISANLRHTNIVEINGMGYWNDIPYIEMEYIDGPSLKELLEKNIRLPMQFSVSVVHCICTALQFAYNQDMTLYGKIYDRLIHRDIKPANILISSKGIVKLADFGIARPSEVSIHTEGSKVMGTFAYLSPEQLNGEKLDQRSDVYSLGTVLYEMLTGAKTFPQKLLAELVQRKSRGQFIPVGSMGVRLPRQLCNAVEKALTFDRSKRFCDAGEFDVELTAALHKVTPRTPEETIKIYLKNPYAPGLHRKINLNMKPFLKLAGIVLMVTAAVLLGIRFAPQYGPKFTSLVQQLGNPVPPPAVAAIPSAVVAPQELPAPVVSVQPAAPSPSVRRQPSDPVAAALNKYNTGNYAAAAEALASLDPDELTTLQRKLRTIRLLQAYQFLGRNEDARNILDGEPVADGLFFLLKSQAAVRQNELESALETARQAQNTPTTIDNGVRKRATFQIAAILHTRFSLKPNQQNTQLAREAWESYLSSYCTNDNGSDDCREANERLIIVGQ